MGKDAVPTPRAPAAPPNFYEYNGYIGPEVTNNKYGSWLYTCKLDGCTSKRVTLSANTGHASRSNLKTHVTVSRAK